MSLNSYLNAANKNFINVTVDNRDLPTSYQYASEAGPSRSYLSGYYMQETPYVVPSPYPVEASPYESNKTIKYYPYFSLYDYAYSGWLNNSNVGVYLSEEGLPTRLNPAMSYAPFFIADDKPMDVFNSMVGFEMRASKMYRALEVTSGKSRFFVSKTRPSSPSTTTPQIYMGLHADGGTPTKKYSSAAKNLDNYIYDNRTVEIVGAGNKSTKGLGGKALAANAITVGAIDPFTNKATGYTAGCNGVICEDQMFHKPEFMNYSHYYFNFPNLPEYGRTYTKGNNYYEYKPLYDGTEAAAALTAGMVSNMLSANEFYRWHPEVVKAVALNGWYQNTEARIRYSDLVFDQSDINNMHTSYYFIGDVNTLMKEYKDCPRNSFLSSCGKEPTKEIRFNFDREELVQNAKINDFDGFVISIAWLNSGNDIYNLGGLPQNFNVEVYSKKTNDSSLGDEHDAWLRASTYQTSGVEAARYPILSQQGNPYRTTRVAGFHDDSEKFTVRIILTDDDSRAENYGQMVLGLDIKPLFKYGK